MIVITRITRSNVTAEYAIFWQLLLWPDISVVGSKWSWTGRRSTSERYRKNGLELRNVKYLDVTVSGHRRGLGDSKDNER